MARQKKEKTSENIKLSKPYIHAVGRRKGAVAGVRLYTSSNNNIKIETGQLNKGDIAVNGKLISDYFRFFGSQPRYDKFLDETGIRDQYVFSIKIEGGGLTSGLEAAILGMARALDKLDREKYHSILRSKGYLTRDSRVRERRKVGMGGKARRKKQSPKR